jgi:hypothetical protein
VSEDVSQPKMRFVDAEKYVKDGVEYTVAYEASGLVTCAAPEEKIPDGMTIGPGSPGWVSYTIKFSVAKPYKMRTIKVSPHSAVGKALVKKS